MLQACKPDPVPDCDRVAIIYLSRQLLTGIHLPTLYRVSLSADLGRAALKRYYMWHFSMQGLPANDVTIISRGLLPHIFILAVVFVNTRTRRRSFSVALSVTSTYFSALVKVPGSSPVHCSVLSGLSYQ
jgi:hypothetical protein